MRPTGFMMLVTRSTVSGRPSTVTASVAASASFHDAGTSTATKAVAPASMALWFMSTTSWPFFR